MGNPFVHIELSTPDVAKAKAFYGKLFDWKLEDMPMGPDEVYTMIGVGEGTGGGMMHTPPGAPPGWYAYVNVDDISATTKKAKDLGAQVMKDVTEIAARSGFSSLRSFNATFREVYRLAPTELRARGSGPLRSR